MSRRADEWRDLVVPELVPLLSLTDSGAQRVRQRVTDLVQQLPDDLPPIHALRRVRRGALSAAGPEAAAQVAAISREADVREGASKLRLQEPSETAGPADPAEPRYRLVGFVRESAGLALACIAIPVTLVMARAIGADSISIDTGAAIGGFTALAAAGACWLLEGRRAASLVLSVRQNAAPLYAAITALWSVGLVTTAVRVGWHEEVLDGSGTVGAAAWTVALLLMLGLVVRSVGTDRRDRHLTAPVDPRQELHWAELGAIQDWVCER